MRSTTVSRSCAFSALSRSSGLGSLSLETCLFGPPLGRRACWRANCRLSTFFILFDRELSFMNYPLYPHHRLSKSTSSARERHGLFRAGALRSGPQSQPIDPEMSGTKAPRTCRDSQHPTFQTVPAATALFFLPSRFLRQCALFATLAMLIRGLL